MDSPNGNDNAAQQGSAASVVQQRRRRIFARPTQPPLSRVGTPEFSREAHPISSVAPLLAIGGSLLGASGGSAVSRFTALAASSALASSGSSSLSDSSAGKRVKTSDSALTPPPTQIGEMQALGDPSPTGGSSAILLPTPPSPTPR